MRITKRVDIGNSVLRTKLHAIVSVTNLSFSNRPLSLITFAIVEYIEYPSVGELRRCNELAVCHWVDHAG